MLRPGLDVAQSVQEEVRFLDLGFDLRVFTSD